MKVGSNVVFLGIIRNSFHVAPFELSRCDQLWLFSGRSYKTVV